ncbi:MAG: hypothetical protein Q8Q02_01955 [Nocardioides sp.]|nr:hypothetical protein [Nocardioides sp.]
MRLLLRGTLLLTVIALLAAMLTGPATASAIEDFADHDGQRHCASTAGPGTTYLLSWVVRTYGGRPGGTLRDCTSGGASEHKDGRALDWTLDARNAADRAAAHRFLTALAAPDRAGNPAALARRMGVMYVIWDDHIYAAYRGFAKAPYLHAACPRRKGCSPTLRHRDHVHLSLSRAGAAAQTSFFRARGVPRVPVLQPGTRLLDPDATASWTATVTPGRTVRTPFRLERGRTYRVVLEGRYRYGAGQRVADAACVWAPRRRTWVPDAQGLTLGGRTPAGRDCANAGAGRPVHELSWTARRTGPAALHLPRRGRAANGGVRVHFLAPTMPQAEVTRATPAHAPAPRAATRPGPRARPLHKERLTLPARARKGRVTTRSLREGARYRVVVTGTARSGNTAYDGGCVRYAGRLRPQHSLDLSRPGADHFALHVQGSPVPMRARRGSRLCSAAHAYVGSFVAPVRGRARVQVWDPTARAGVTRRTSGALTVRVVRLGRTRPGRLS